MHTPGTLLREFWDRIAAGRIESAIELLDPEGVFWSRPVGNVPMRGFIDILRGVQTAIPMTFTYYETMEKGDRAFLEMEGHGRCASGEPYNNRYVWRMDMRNGRIFELREYSDTAYANDVFARNLPPDTMAVIARWIR